MFLSMTGFGSKSYDFSWGTVVFELSSINHKFQDFLVKLPPELSALENRMLNIMRSSIGRGRVKLSASITWTPGAEVPQLDEEGLINLFNQIRKFTKKNNLDCPNDITNLLLIPGLFSENNNLAAQEVVKNPEIWDRLAREAIDALMEMKKSEGEKLKLKIEEDLKLLEDFLEKMKERWKAARNAALNIIKTRIESVLEHYNLELDEARIAEEVSLAADRWDISEEITRMEAHTEKFWQVMDAQEASGKKLDFLIQEMNREVNTMGSKVADADFRWLVVEAKTCIERIREQIQNVE
ncbi:MAG: YicC/YloC family endoribonuclease [Synergistales bacterium]|nr:YicC/YloC family endoribonuclease [Synergistales bacterium]MDY6400985.1 YicC/YloC family endoribonuclease [Synergistales bacterium]MDY6404899.1 YicC/YloC family endoribonuclease [Synergistales bacterium]MDY6411086.1 YicC/YloC family endoribonuclease [Synergistales bacterium]MDY6414886.1 YicC/YloC family endoribonuclease [Synergistales bacterium]